MNYSCFRFYESIKFFIATFQRRNKMGFLVQFPNANTLNENLCNHPLLNSDDYKEKGITSAIANLSVKRFANKKMSSVSVRMGIMLMIYDLKNGKDGFTGELLPNLGNLDLNDIFWAQVSISTEQALLDCSMKVTTNVSAFVSREAAKACAAGFNP